MRFSHRSVSNPFSGSAIVALEPGPNQGWFALFGDNRLVQIDSGGKVGGAFPLTAGRPSPADGLVLRLSADGRYVAVLEEFGSHGTVWRMPDAEIVATLNRGEYRTNLCSFPFAFIQRDAKTLICHATDWNRLDLTDLDSGKCLTSRLSVSPNDAGSDSKRYLDYFHGALSVSPDQSWIAEYGWIWHPMGVVRTWSLDSWLSGNVWESENGSSIHNLSQCDSFWDGPLAWLDNQRLAVWGLGDDEEELQPGISIFDVRDGQRLRTLAGPSIAPHRPWPIGSAKRGWMVFHGYLFAISPDSGTAVWDIESGERFHFEKGYVPDRFHPETGEFISASEHRLSFGSFGV